MVTVADMTFVVTFGAPAELVVDPGAGAATTVVAGAGVVVAGAVSGVAVDAAGLIVLAVEAFATICGAAVVPEATAGVAEEVEPVVTARAPGAGTLLCVTVTLRG